MKRIIKSATMLVVAAATCSVAIAQNTNNMTKDTVKNTMQAIENGVVSGYKAIENGVVGGYTAMQDGIVEGFTRVSDAFIMKFFAHKGETLEQAKARMRAEEAKLRQQDTERASAGKGSNGETTSTNK